MYERSWDGSGLCLGSMERRDSATGGSDQHNRRQYRDDVRLITQDRQLAVHGLQRNAVVMSLAERLGNTLLFLPSYTPKTSYIERLSKFLKRHSLYGRVRYQLKSPNDVLSETPMLRSYAMCCESRWR